MATICQQCGDRGVSEALVNCDTCQTTAVHRYCLNVLPSFDEDVIWNCEDCEPKVAKPFTLDNHNSLLHGKFETGDLEIVPVNESVKELKKKQKRRGAICSFAKAEVHECKDSSRHHLEVHHSENHEKDQKFRRLTEQDGINIYEEAEPVKPKPSLIAGGDCKSNPESGCELHCSNSDKNNENLGRQIVMDGSTSYEEAELVNTRTRVVTNGLPICLQYSSNVHKEPNLKVHNSGNKKKKKKLRRQRKLARKIYDAEIESVKISPLAADNNARMRKYGSNVWDMSIIEVQCNGYDERDQRLIRRTDSNGASSNEGSESVTTEASLVASRKPSNIPKQRFSIPAQPIIEPIWRGNLSLRNCKYGTIQRLVAHLSTSACAKVFQEAKLLPELLCPELLPRSYAWPKSFHRWGPKDDDIAIYLFPKNERDEKIYDWLVDDMIRHDLAMSTLVNNAELLLFTSILLPSLFWRFQSKFYLWGVFRGKQASSRSQALALYSPNPISIVEPRYQMDALTWHARRSPGPINPLSHRW